MSLVLREAQLEDAKEIWEINRHPSVRAASFSNGDIPWPQHLDWFKNSLKGSTREIYVCCDLAEIVAVIRFDCLQAELGEISIAVKTGVRGKGVGRWSIAEASKRYTESTGNPKVIRAYIKLNNLASQKAFEAAGYRRVGKEEVQGEPVYRYHLQVSTPEPGVKGPV